jgi:hypothetical protein
MRAIQRLRGSYQGLLVSVFLLLVVSFLAREGRVVSLVLEGLFSLVLVAGVVSASARRGFPRLALALALTALGLRWAVRLSPSPTLAVLALATTLLFLAVAQLALLRDILSARRVSGDIILGSVCGYLLLGLTWAVALQLLEVVGWSAAGVGWVAGERLTAFTGHAAGLSDLLYLSFVTLSTLGYGDIVPLTPGARLLAVLEAVSGQLYIAILIARLVALHIVHQQQGE